MHSPEEFRDNLRELAEKFAAGELNEFFLHQKYIDSCADESFPKKVTAAYMRVTMERNDSLRACGTLSIKKEIAEHGEGFRISINRGKARNSRRNTETNRAIDMAVMNAISKKIDAILAISPSLEEFEGEQCEGAKKAIAMYKDIIKGMK